MRLEAEQRTAGKTSALRRKGRLPGIIYNKKINVPISVELRAFDRIFRSQGTSSIIDLEIAGEDYPVLVKAVQMDKRHRLPLHVDFFAITADQPVDINVPLDFVGTAAGSREGGLVDMQRREIHISVLPRFIPEHIKVDVSELAIGDSIHIRDIMGLFPAEATILDDEDLTVVTVLAPRAVVADEVAEEEEEIEPEVISKGVEEEIEEE
ncbi:MAG: 50S ribosomal protein L25 [Trueperaceae bacterium]|nr:MAG: 50S ribosomal protein L25 [Trueperaceae bacterium]